MPTALKSSSMSSDSVRCSAFVLFLACIVAVVFCKLIAFDLSVNSGSGFAAPLEIPNLGFKTQEMIEIDEKLVGGTGAAAQAIYESEGAAAYQSRPLIPGTRLLTVDAVSRFESRFDCLVSKGQWILDPTPRLLPWGKEYKLGYSSCDYWWTTEAQKNISAQGAGSGAPAFRNVAYDAADGVARRRGAKAVWQVRPSVKYRWELPRQKGGDADDDRAEGGRSRECDVEKWWGEVDCEQLKAGLVPNGGKIMIVGDSLNLELLEAFLNLMNMCHKRCEFEVRKKWHEEWKREKEVQQQQQEDQQHLRQQQQNQQQQQSQQQSRQQQQNQQDQQQVRWLLQQQLDEKVKQECPAVQRIMKDSCADHQKIRQIFWHCRETRYGNTTILFIRNDLLSTSDGYLIEPLHCLNTPWMKKVTKENNVSVLLLNRGAHYEEDNIFVPDLNATLHAVREAAPDALVIFRSTPGGHPNCTREIIDPYKKPPDSSSFPYHWGDFHRQNMIAKQLVREIGGVFMDVERMTVLRPDGHMAPPRDCLHYCLPGPLDTWVRMFYHMLIQLL